MFCGRCGSEVGNGASYCPKCGAKLNEVYARCNQDENTIAVVGFIFSFFIALVGLVCSVIGYQNASRGAKYSGLSVAGIIISIISMVLGLVFGIIAVIYY